MTDYVRELRPGGGGDYTTFAAWQADHGGAVSKDLVGNGDTVTLECYGSGITENFTLTGWTTGASNYITIIVPEAERHDGTPGTGFVWQNSGASTPCTITGATYTRITGMEFFNNATVNYRYAFQINTGANNSIFESCIMRATSTASGHTVAETSSRDTEFRNCLFIGDGANTNACVVSSANNNQTYNNCTFVDATGTGGFGLNLLNTNGSYLSDVRNCVSYNCTEFYDDSIAVAWTTTTGYNASSTYTTTAPPDEVGGSNYTSNVVSGDFEATGSDDYHLATGSNLIGVGVDISGSFTTDIDGDTRSSWDIGMDEFVSSGSAAITGTATASIAEADIVAGGKTIIITLTGDTWVASGATFDAQRQNIIDGLDAASSPTNGWNNEVRDKLAVGTVVRTSDTVVTITLSAQSGYNISAQETITVTVPASALVTSATPYTATPTFTVDYTAYATISGTALNADWKTIRDSGGTIIVTLVDDTFIAAGTGPIGTTAQSDAFVQSFTAAASPAGGWNNQISLDNTDLVRTSNTVATITIPATGTYNPQQREVIDGEVQAAILTTSISNLSLDSFSIQYGAWHQVQHLRRSGWTVIKKD